jgi:hypothetical protein
MKNKERPAKMTASPKSVEELTGYLRDEFDGGAYLRRTFVDGDVVDERDGVRRMPLKVVAYAEVNVTVPSGVEEREVWDSLRVHVESSRFPVETLVSGITSNEK